MRRARSRLPLFVCAALLLWAQFGALTHAVWHAASPVRGHEHAAAADQPLQPAGDATHNDEAPSTQAAICAFDLACGQVLGGVHAGAAPLVVMAATVIISPDVPASRLHAETLTPKSRGPPALL